MMISKPVKILGFLVRGIVFGVCAVIVAVIGVLFSIYVDAHWLPMTSHEETVRILKLSGVSFEAGPECPSSKSFLLGFSSGREEEVAFPGDADVAIGEKYRLCYSRSKLYKAITVKSYGRVSGVTHQSVDSVGGDWNAKGNAKGQALE